MEAVLIILGMAVVTFFTRFVMIALLGGSVAARAANWLKYVPVAILAALVVPGLLPPGKTAQAGPEALAGLAGLLVARRTDKVLPAILTGFATYWLIRLASG